MVGPTLLLLSLPVQVLAALVVRIKLGGPVLYRQQIPGRNGKPFTIIKFRPMTDERGASGKNRSDSERLTTFRRHLQSTSLDRLPEIFNVLKGDMSLVVVRLTKTTTTQLAAAATALIQVQTPIAGLVITAVPAGEAMKWAVFPGSAPAEV